jgi:hypothetical protein
MEITIAEQHLQAAKLSEEDDTKAPMKARSVRTLNLSGEN